MWCGIKISFSQTAHLFLSQAFHYGQQLNVFFNMVNKTQEIIHSVSLFHKSHQLHITTTSSFIPILEHLCFTAHLKTEHITQSHTQLELSFTRHTTQQPIKAANGLRRNSYMMGIIWLVKTL